MNYKTISKRIENKINEIGEYLFLERKSTGKVSKTFRFFIEQINRLIEILFFSALIFGIFLFPDIKKYTYQDITRFEYVCLLGLTYLTYILSMGFITTIIEIRNDINKILIAINPQKEEDIRKQIKIKHFTPLENDNEKIIITNSHYQEKYFDKYGKTVRSTFTAYLASKLSNGKYVFCKTYFDIYEVENFSSFSREINGIGTLSLAVKEIDELRGLIKITLPFNSPLSDLSNDFEWNKKLDKEISISMESKCFANETENENFRLNIIQKVSIEKNYGIIEYKEEFNSLIRDKQKVYFPKSFDI